MKKNILCSLALGLICCACSQDITENTVGTANTKTTTVNLQITTGGWNGATRANGELLEPVTLLLVPEDGATVVTRKVVEGSDFSIEVPNGSYDIFAVCGLPADIVPDDLFETIAPPTSDSSNGLVDFAVGSASIVNDFGRVSPSTVSINAKHQMAWLTLTVSDVPTYFASLALYVRGLAETYNLANSWTSSVEGKSRLSKFVLIRKPGKKTASTDIVTIPCIDKTSGTEFRIEAKTTDDKTLTYTYKSTTPLVAGKHLTLNLSVSDLAVVSESIDLDAWENAEESATLTTPTVE